MYNLSFQLQIVLRQNIKCSVEKLETSLALLLLTLALQQQRRNTESSEGEAGRRRAARGVQKNEFPLRAKYFPNSPLCFLNSPA